ncbi:MAG: hypothetical protein FRX48_03482 [Lasallia pustulata]|uniref:Uncharacterized protein n=1 Tax=Lasallia pustulata TaxID=136370 RepID=A0A5M8PV01_9LECA|nr:MAG: hypothetical protein FRX48_03482 [Lasallia pustulata]
MSPARLSTRLLPRTVYSELELEEPGWAFLLLLMPPRAWLAASWMQVIQWKAADALQMVAKRRGKWRVCDALCFFYHSSAGMPMQHARTPTPQIVWPFAILSLHALLYALPFVAASPRPLPLPQSRRPLPSRISCQLFNPLTFFLCRQFQLSVNQESLPSINANSASFVFTCLTASRRQPARGAGQQPNVPDYTAYIAAACPKSPGPMWL